MNAPAKRLNREELKARREERAQTKAKLDAQIEAVGVVAAIGQVHRDRIFLMTERIRCENALGAFLRTGEGWSRDLPSAERKAIEQRVQAMLKEGVPKSSPYYRMIQVSRSGSAQFSEQEDEESWKLEYLATKLPVWSGWAEAVNGFGALSLGVIIGETGDLSNYPDHSKLWKRMGVAVMDGVRQGGLRKTATAEEWTAHGYSRKRRARLYVIGDCLYKKPGHYQDYYRAEKERQRAKAEAAGLIVQPSAKIPKKNAAAYMSDGHVHNRAMRHMQKRLLKHLWQAWRRASTPLPETAAPLAPAADSHTNGSGEEPGRRAKDRTLDTAIIDLPAAMELA